MTRVAQRRRGGDGSVLGPLALHCIFQCIFSLVLSERISSMVCACVCRESDFAPALLSSHTPANVCRVRSRPWRRSLGSVLPSPPSPTCTAASAPFHPSRFSAGRLVAVRISLSPSPELQRIFAPPSWSCPSSSFPQPIRQLLPRRRNEKGGENGELRHART